MFLVESSCPDGLLDGAVLNSEHTGLTDRKGYSAIVARSNEQWTLLQDLVDKVTRATLSLPVLTFPMERCPSFCNLALPISICLVEILLKNHALRVRFTCQNSEVT
jgi:hypothetical protein